MKTLKKVIRVIVLGVLIILAVSGVGIVGAFLPNNREKFMDKEIRIERVDKKEGDEEDVQQMD